jgi:uncharacterized protein YegP (UPF0339 family)
MIRFVIYRARDGFRWRLLAANNFIVAESGEAYDTEYGVRRAVDWVKLNAPQAPIA